jgi:hypothetical protein
MPGIGLGNSHERAEYINNTSKTEAVTTKELVLSIFESKRGGYGHIQY